MSETIPSPEVETATVDDLEDKDHLTYIETHCELDSILEDLSNELRKKGLIHDTDSIVREDSFSSLWVAVSNADYSEVWACHYDTPRLNDRVFRIL